MPGLRVALGGARRHAAIAPERHGTGIQSALEWRSERFGGRTPTAEPAWRSAWLEIFERPCPEEAYVLMQDSISIREARQLDDTDVAGLSDVLLDCVAGGASVGFMHPLTRQRAERFWRKVAADVASGDRAVLVAEDAAGICGTVQLVLGMPENQPHRADPCKMLVHGRARRRGVGAALMARAEELATARGRSLLVLDAVTDGEAARLYARLGWRCVGDVPGFALMPDGSPCGTTFFYKSLAPTP